MITVANRAKLCFFTFLNHNCGADNWLIAENSKQESYILSSCQPFIIRFILTVEKSLEFLTYLEFLVSYSHSQQMIQLDWRDVWKVFSHDKLNLSDVLVTSDILESQEQLICQNYRHMQQTQIINHIFTFLLLQHEDKKWQVIHWIFFSLYSSSTLFQVLFPLVLSAQDRGQRRRSYHQPRVHQAAHLYLNLTALIHCAQV